MNIKQIIGIALVLFFSSGYLYAGDEQLLIQKGNKAYSQGNYQEAVQFYKNVADKGFEAPELYYNLGNSYFKMNDFPGAILWYERAKRLDPSNEDIIFNLNVANTKISDKIEPLPEMFYQRWFRTVVQLTSIDGWAKFGVILFIIALFCGVLYLASGALVIRKIGFGVGIVLIITAIFSFLFSWSGYSRKQSTSEAIIFTPTITVKSSPDDKSTDLFVVHEGTKITILDHIGNWYEIRIANGSVGWLPATVLEKI